MSTSDQTIVKQNRIRKFFASPEVQDAAIKLGTAVVTVVITTVVSSLVKAGMEKAIEAIERNAAEVTEQLETL